MTRPRAGKVAPALLYGAMLVGAVLLFLLIDACGGDHGGSAALLGKVHEGLLGELLDVGEDDERILR